MVSSEAEHFSFRQLILPAYKEFWTKPAYYYVLAGGRGSGKSTQTAFKLLYSLLSHPDVNILCVRATLSSLKDSCYATFEWAINKLGLRHRFRFRVNPLEIIYIDTGQKILFRGLDDPEKITSLAVARGLICRVWFEEAFQIRYEKDFDKVCHTIRGVLPKGLRIEYYLTFNPWSAKTWIKRRFFDPDPLYPNGNPRIFTLVTNYKQNPYLNKEYVREFDELAIRNPKWYAVNCLGEWGHSDGAIFNDWEQKEFDFEEIRHQTEKGTMIYGLDFGWNDPTALFCGFVDQKKKIIYVYDEIYKFKITYMELYRLIVKKGYGMARIVADSSEKTAIQTLKQMGLRNLTSSKKGSGSILTGIHKIQDYHIIVHPKCTHFISEISNYEWAQDKDEVLLDHPIDEHNHLMDAMRYAMEIIRRGSMFYVPK